MVACGASHTLALGVNGQVFSFGQGLYGALGLSETGGAMRDRPKLITGLQNTRIVEIAAGARHSLFLSESRKVFACGEAKQGQLGLGPITVDRIMVPTHVKTLNEVQKIACGKYHSLHLSASGQIYACGSNAFGQLGTGCKSNYFTPTLIESLSNVKSMAGWHFSAALTHDNRL
jgi:alpha-tubulin suppressor-like RCC1 family protein